jgi:enamine deaminase RidA (YjgF/YER057c/UK114 family)
MTECQQPGLFIEPRDSHDPYRRLAELGIRLHVPSQPPANFVHAVEVGALLYISGQSPREPDGILHTGKVGAGVSTKDAQLHARIVAINLLAILHHHLGDLRRVRRVVKVLGMVNCTAEYTEHPEVINGCSDLLVDVLGPKVGKHARSAVGFVSLPRQITVEIELIAEFGAAQDTGKSAG